MIINAASGKLTQAIDQFLNVYERLSPHQRLVAKSLGVDENFLYNNQSLKTSRSGEVHFNGSEFDRKLEVVMRFL